MNFQYINKTHSDSNLITGLFIAFDKFTVFQNYTRKGLSKIVTDSF